MLRAWKLGRVAGIDVYLHWSVLLLPFVPLVFHSSERAAAGGPRLAVEMVLLPTIFFCVLLHEFGHALMALAFGIRTADITLYPIGGVARLANTGRSAGTGPLGTPWQELWIALAGPAVNVVIAVGLFLIDQVVDFQPHTFVGEFAGWLFYSNIFLVIFNMMPFFPMDGGRVLRALLAVPMGQLRATEVATTLGLGVAVFFLWWGIASGNPMLILITGVIFFLGQQEVAMLRHRAAAEQAGEGWPVRQVTVHPSAFPPEEDFSGFTFDRENRAWIVWKNGRPLHGCGLD